MDEKSKLILSICVPAYNRPQQLLDLLKSIDCRPDGVEIIVCEDNSPKRLEIGLLTDEFSRSTHYQFKYFENQENLGFDGNIRELIRQSNGEFLIFMGDDDLFIPGALEKYIAFIKSKIGTDYGYVLRSYVSVHENGDVEEFRYLPRMREFDSGEDSVAWLYKRSVTITAFTIKRVEALKYSTSLLDGTLLYQVYLMAEVCLTCKSIYCDFPVAIATQSFRLDKPMFGSAKSESGRYESGVVSPGNSINFTKAYFEVAKFIDARNGTSIVDKVRVSLSKYSYPFLSIQRKRGVKIFLDYTERLEKECGLGCTPYFYIYKYGLIIFGEKNCDKMILWLKRQLSFTPNL